MIILIIFTAATWDKSCRDVGKHHETCHVLPVVFYVPYYIIRACLCVCGACACVFARAHMRARLILLIPAIACELK